MRKAALWVLAVLMAGCAHVQVGRGHGGYSFSHDGWDAVLRRHTFGGAVNYEGIAADADFHRYMEELAEARPDELPTREDRMAFWINAYNAMLVAAVIERWPVESVREISSVPGGVFRLYRRRIGGRNCTLYGIEHGILRRFGDARVHFALCRGALGGPKLRQGAYTGRGLDRQLDEAARDFINDPANVRIDRRAKSAELSRVFYWFKGDFERDAGSLGAYIARWLPRPDREVALRPDLRVRFLPYDWTLNRPR